MKTTATKQLQTETVQPKANKQAGTQQILQRYKQQTAQLQAAEEEDLLQGKFETAQRQSVDEEEPVQGKFELVQLKSELIQKVDASQGWKLKYAYKKAILANDIGVYYSTLNSLEYPNEEDLSDEPTDPTFQFKSKVIQMARSPFAISGPKNYGGYKGLIYQCDAQGNIDFSSPFQYYIGNPYPGLDPVVPGSTVDVGNAVANYGKGNRYRHFQDANQQRPNFGGQNGYSPAGHTWHHLTAKHQMHLVDSLVHSKHGHNGGVYLW